MVLAAFLFMKRMAEVTNVSELTREMHDDDPGVTERRRPWQTAVPPGVQVYEINGPFFFGAAEKFKETMGEIGDPPKVLIIRLRNVPAIDSTGIAALRDLVRRVRKDGTLALFAEVHSQPMMALGRSGLTEEIGVDALVDSVEEAIARAREHLRLPALQGVGPPIS
jgi:sulfate permease, SulP family